MKEHPVVAYFSMEIALRADLPTYSGGLGVLAGDTIRAAADLGINLVGVSLVHRKGYFRQRLDADGTQHEEPEEWNPGAILQEMPQRVTIDLEGRSVVIRAWKYDVRGIGDSIVPVFLLDADLSENREPDRRLTDFLYGGDQRYRLCQEAILGIAGVRILRALGYQNISRYHLNEGHSALLGLELLEEEMSRVGAIDPTPEIVEIIRERCAFTTHTPIPAGHDRFTLPLVEAVLGQRHAFHAKNVFCCEGEVNMTHLALNLSRYVNGVAKKHAETTRLMFANYPISAITNGVHAATWAAPAFAELFDKHIPDWRKDNASLRYAISISPQEVWNAHMRCKTELFDAVKKRTGIEMNQDVITLGFARRATGYKRPSLLLQNPSRLRSIAAGSGGIQIIYGGKAHPRDQEGKDLIKAIFRAKDLLKDDVKIAYLENYEMELGRLLTAGVDLWVNTPQRPMEASGTSGMKAALNGVPSFSILDGWWLEGCIEGVTGWAIGENGDAPPSDSAQDSQSLYEKLEKTVIPTFRNRDAFMSMMLHCISLNGSFFNTHRMMQQYVINAYFR